MKDETLVAHLLRFHGGEPARWRHALMSQGLSPSDDPRGLRGPDRIRWMAFLGRDVPKISAEYSTPPDRDIETRSLEDWAWACLRLHVELFEPWRLAEAADAGRVAAEHERLVLAQILDERLLTAPPLPETEELRALRATHTQADDESSEGDPASREAGLRAWLLLRALERSHRLSETFMRLAPFHRGSARPVRLVVQVANVGQQTPTSPLLIPASLVIRTRVAGVDYWTLPSSDRPEAPPAEEITPIRNDLPASLEDAVRASAGMLCLVPPRPADAMPLTLAPMTREGLDHLRLRWRHRDAVTAATGTGLFALLSGPSGHGRASAAIDLTAQLGIPLLRIEAGAITSPWIGETEKRITRVFEAARRVGAALLIEDADDLFAPRTEVVHSVDRYANMSTNHLLQQVDAFDGLCLLTAGGTQGFDSAMKRRIAVTVRFPDMDAAARSQVFEAAIAWLERRVEPARWPAEAIPCDYLGAISEGMTPSDIVRLVIEVGVQLAIGRDGLAALPFPGRAPEDPDPFVAAVIRAQRRAGMVSGALADRVDDDS